MPNTIAKTWQFVPLPGRPDAARIGAERWHEAAASAPDSALREAARALAAEPGWAPLLTGIFGSSPFLTECLLSNLDLAVDYSRAGPEGAIANILARLDRETGTEVEFAAVDRALRAAKRRVALAVALADLSAAWPLETVTRASARR